MDTYQWNVLVTYHWDVVECFIWDWSETWRTDGTELLRPLKTSSRCFNKMSGRRTIKTSWHVPSRRRWVFHLRRTCDIAGTYRETSLRRRDDVLLTLGLELIFWIYYCCIIFFGFSMHSKYRDLIKPHFFHLFFKSILSVKY